MIEGIDVSNHQGFIDWARVYQAGKRFAICKATEGLDFEDFWYPQNVNGCEIAHIIPGAYHYAKPSQSSGADQALYFLDYCQPHAGVVLALDLEEGPPGAGLAAFALDFLDTCYAQTGARPWLYSAWAFLHEHGLTDEPRLGEYGLWQASWQSESPIVPEPWEWWAAWQYSAVGFCPGVQGNCDLDRFNGTARQLRKYATS